MRRSVISRWCLGLSQATNDSKDGVVAVRQTGSYNWGLLDWICHRLMKD